MNQRNQVLATAAYSRTTVDSRSLFGFDDATAGMLGTVTLVMSGVGGLVFGYVADRFGRTRALMGTIAVFSLASPAKVPARYSR